MNGNDLTKAVKIPKKHHGAVFWLLVAAALGLGMLFFDIIVRNLGLEEKDVDLGVTYSKLYAAELGIDWKEGLTASLDDLGARRFRIPAYWTDIEPEQGEFDFSDVDWQLAEIGKRGGSVILAVGRKLPRWPECHIPGWAKQMDEDLQQAKVMAMLEAAVGHFSRSPTVAAWQVENEPLFDFGLCPEPDADFLKREIALVKSLDYRPVMVTESGELSAWVRAASSGADTLGISTYRVVWNRLVGYFFWPITPKNYQRKAFAVTSLVDRVIVSELQGEPWSPGPIKDMPIDRQLEVMGADRLKSNVVFARRIGFPEVYLWGVEWWYWLKAQGHPELWDAAKEIFAASKAKS
jgi:hypothetical protein